MYFLKKSISFFFFSILLSSCTGDYFKIPELFPNTIEKTIYHFNYLMNSINNDKIFENLSYILSGKAKKEFFEILDLISDLRNKSIQEEEKKLKEKEKTILKVDNENSESSLSSSFSKGEDNLIKSIVNQKVVLSKNQKTYQKYHFDTISLFLKYSKSIKIQIIKIIHQSKKNKEDKETAIAKTYFFYQNLLKIEQKDLYLDFDQDKKIWRIYDIVSKGFVE